MTLPPSEVDEAVARALSQFGVEAVATTFVSASENIVYRVDARDGERYALRVHRSGYHQLAELESELSWVGSLADGGIDTPRPLVTLTGEAYATVPYGTDGDTRQVGVAEWVDGEPLDAFLAREDSRLEETYRKLGEVVARMHLHAIGFTPRPGFVRHRLDGEGILGEDPWWGPFWHVPEFSASEAARVLEVREGLRRRLASYGTGPDAFGLIHADLVPSNALVRSDGSVAPIDFDDLAFGYFLYDLAVPLSELVGQERFPAVRDALLAGYERFRPLSDEERSLLPMFILIRVLAQIGWFNSRLDGHLTYDRGWGSTREGLIGSCVRQALLLMEECRPILAAAS